MDNSPNINEGIHETVSIRQGDFFLQQGKPCDKIGKLMTGVMRGYTVDSDGNEVTTHFYQEQDMVVGSYIPNVDISMSIQALTACTISVANYLTVMSQVNKNLEITTIINREFQKLNRQLQSRLVSLLNLSALKKYELFLQDYPGLLNKIPHYYIAQYLGITPTQLSRVRKQFINKCK